MCSGVCVLPRGWGMLRQRCFNRAMQAAASNGNLTSAWGPGGTCRCADAEKCVRCCPCSSSISCSCGLVGCLHNIACVWLAVQPLGSIVCPCAPESAQVHPNTVSSTPCSCTVMCLSLTLPLPLSISLCLSLPLSSCGVGETQSGS